MARTTKEWIGTSDDTPVPPRVRLRVYLRDAGVCCCGCGRKINPGEKWECDHIVAIVNGGENRETNLRTLLTEHHRSKSREDLREKSQTYKKRKANLGIKKQTSFRGWRRFDGTIVYAKGKSK